MGKYVMAKYIRLSMEDVKNDSMSIESQRLLLDAHIAEMCIPDAEILEFVDNGHSGTDFERPAVQELLELIRQGKINCVIVKDLSRFGRNMIETGYYLERVFPLFRIRFIAVSDAYDSSEYEGGTGGMDIAFKFLIHEQYSRDISMKIKTAKRAKAVRGELVLKNCAFGFKKVDNRLEIDETAAKVIRLIFSMAADGQSLTQIATRLYEDNHPTPSEYKQLSRQVSENGYSCIWGKSQLLSILSDEQYIGTYIAGKTKILDVGSGKAVKVDESEWTKIVNHHPAIVDKVIFDAACKKIDERGEPLRNRKIGTWERYRKITSPLQGKVVCGCCGHTMSLSSTKNAAFHCGFTRAAPDMECYRHKKMADELETIVLSESRKQARQILDCAKGATSWVSASTEIETRLMQIEDAKRVLYERFVLGEITAGKYHVDKEGIDTELRRVKNVQVVLTKEAMQKASVADVQQSATDTLNANELSKSIVDALIDIVRVYPDNRVEIDWILPMFSATIVETTEKAS